MISKAAPRFFLIAAATYCAFRSSTSAAVLLSGAVFSASAVRLVNFTLAAAAPLPRMNNLSAPSNIWSAWSGVKLRMLLDGCPLSRDGITASITSCSTHDGDGMAAVFDLGKRLQANGFELTFAAGAVPPLAWLFEMTTSLQIDDVGASEWRPAAASAFRRSYDGLVIPYPRLPSAAQSATATVLKVDLRPDWQWASQFVVSYGLAMVTFSIVLVLALMDRQRHARWLFAAHYGLVSLLYAAAVAEYQLRGRSREASAVWLLLPEHVMVSVGLMAFKGRWVSCIARSFRVNCTATLFTLLWTKEQIKQSTL